MKGNEIKNICQLSIATRNIMHDLIQMQHSKYLYQVFRQDGITEDIEQGYCEDPKPRNL